MISPSELIWYHIQRLDHYLGWTGFYTAMNAPYDVGLCRKYSQDVLAEAQNLEFLFWNALTRAKE